MGKGMVYVQASPSKQRGRYDVRALALVHENDKKEQKIQSASHSARKSKIEIEHNLGCDGLIKWMKKMKLQNK